MPIPRGCILRFQLDRHPRSKHELVHGRSEGLSLCLGGPSRDRGGGSPDLPGGMFLEVRVVVWWRGEIIVSGVQGSGERAVASPQYGSDVQ